MRLSFVSISLAAVGVAVLVLGTADTADAHVCMVYPVSRVGPECTARSPQKLGPCGVNERTDQYVSEFRPGETIVVELNETVDHPSHYRISFNPVGDTFYDPRAIDDMSGELPFVLVDGIEDATEARESVRITFPDVECDACTLQLIQVMYDKQGNGFGGGGVAAGGNDDLYYSCADIVLKRENSADAGNVAPAAPTARGGDAGGDPETPAAPRRADRFLAGRAAGLVTGVRRLRRRA